ncbi:MAG TPA: hypothetical protein VJ608_11120, partial [Albitalea sp.]|nr:hypothetical protein [Albitalea sp.]
MSAAMLHWFDALRGRIGALLPKRGGGQDLTPRAGRPIPVRDWIAVGSGGAPTRLLGFDQALVCVVVALLALGIVMVYSATVA